MFACIYGQSIPDGVSLQDFAYSFSPLVEETATDTVVLDVEGCELLFGSAYELANEIANCAVKRKESGGLGCKVSVAVAANPDAAIHAARCFNGISFIASGEELTSLGDLPIESLKFQVSSLKSKQIRDVSPETWDTKVEEILETLRLWGIHTFREFAALPTAGVSERLGQEGIKLQELASGKTHRHLKLKQPAPVFEHSIELEHPLVELEPLSFIFARLLNQLCASLNAYALATNELRIQLKLEDGTSHERQLSLPHPMRDHKIFLRLLLLDAEMHPPQSAVHAVSIACEPVKPRVLQNGLFIPLAPEPEKLELTLARLAKLLGPDNVGSPELVDTHRPDAFHVKRFGLRERLNRTRHRVRNSQSAIHRSPQRGSPAGVVNPKCLLGFRVFRPPLRAIVQADRGYPTQISAWGANRSVHGRIVRMAGPWRTTGDWWRSDAWARDEWDVAVKSNSDEGGHRRRSPQRSSPGSPAEHLGWGAIPVGVLTGPPLQILYRIYRELRSGTWFVEGIYD
jgi:protein ImuB